MNGKALHAQLLYEDEDQVFSWTELMALYAKPPRILIDTRDMFLLARPVIWEDQAGILVEKLFWPQDCDTWFIWLFVGDIKQIASVLPYPLPRVVYRRMNGSLHFYEFNRLKRLVNP